MKKIILVTVLFFAFLFLKAQTYIPFPDSNIVWSQNYWYTDFNPTQPCVINNDFDLFINGDTTLGGNTYHKLYSNGHLYASCPPPGWYYFGSYWGAFRQDTLNKRVYLNINGNDALAYDFNLNVGDTLPSTCLSGSSSNYVQSIDSILIGTKYHKQFWLSDLFQQATNYASLIEGIGSSLGTFPAMAPPFESGNTMYCVKMNNQTVWTNPLYPGIQCNLFSVSLNENSINEKKVSIYPNPVSDFLSIEVNSKTEKKLTLVLYNLLGVEQKLFSFSKSTQLNVKDIATGIYIYKIMDGCRMIGVGKIIKD